MQKLKKKDWANEKFDIWSNFDGWICIWSYNTGAGGKNEKKCPRDDIGVLLDMNALGRSVWRDKNEAELGVCLWGWWNGAGGRKMSTSCVPTTLPTMSCGASLWASHFNTVYNPLHIFRKNSNSKICWSRTILNNLNGPSKCWWYKTCMRIISPSLFLFQPNAHGVSCLSVWPVVWSALFLPIHATNSWQKR